MNIHEINFVQEYENSGVLFTLVSFTRKNECNENSTF